jgi:YggT family protein
MAMSKILRELTSFVFGLVEISLIFRFILKLFGASERAGFVAFVYENTEVLLGPFQFAFPTESISGRFVIEFTTLFAIFVYAFVSYLVQELLDFMDRRERKK